MPTSVPVEVVNHLKRPIPADLEVVPESLPVISFGDPSTARVATVSLNPSWQEFQSKGRNWLTGPKMRLESLNSLERNHPSELTEDDISKVVLKCNTYFEGNPYKPWFNQLNVINKIFGASYYEGSACHLDLVQWATSTVQKDLPKSIWLQLVEMDKDFLRWQFETTSAKVILINGSTSIKELIQVGLVPELEKIVLPYTKTNGHKGSWTIQHGHTGDKKIIGWSGALASGIPAKVREEFLEILTTL